jgi:hypothetical protein
MMILEEKAEDIERTGDYRITVMTMQLLQLARSRHGIGGTASFADGKLRTRLPIPLP